VSEVKRYRLGDTFAVPPGEKNPSFILASDFDALAAQLAEARAELAAVIKLAAGYQRDADALRAAVERHNTEARKGIRGHCGRCGAENLFTCIDQLLITLPAAAGDVDDIDYEKAGAPAAQGSAEPFHAPHVTDDGQIVRTVRDVFFAERGRAGAEPKVCGNHKYLCQHPEDCWEEYGVFPSCPPRIVEQQSTAPEGDIK